MSALTANSNYFGLDKTTDSPTSSSPKSPSSFSAQQGPIRPLMTTIPSIRGQTAPFPLTPTSAHMQSLFEPPSGVSFADFIRKWTDTHVARWLSDIKCGSHAAVFKANDIRGDILLELDQTTLQEMGVSSVGDRLRILNAVKILRQKCAAKPVPPTSRPEETPAPKASEAAATSSSRQPRRLESGRPAPLLLSQNRNGDLPKLVREPPDSARSAVTPNLSNGRVMPSQPAPGSSTSTPHIVSSSSNRPGLPPMPPVPAGKPPLPPNRTPNRLNSSSSTGRRTPTQGDAPPAYATQALPPPPSQGINTPSSGSSWFTSSDPRSGRSGSPLPPGRPAPSRVNVSSAHGRNNSLAALNSPVNASPAKVQRPSTAGSHPYANVQTLQIPTSNRSVDLSPISETHPHNSSSPPNINLAGRSPFTPSHTTTLSEDWRKKLIKFYLPDEGMTFTIDVENCVAGVEVIEKVLKKYGKGRNNDVDSAMDNVQIEDGGLSVDGWGVFIDETSTEPLNESQLLSICQSPPDHPLRESPLIMRKIAKARRLEVTSRKPNAGVRNATKRASAVSILSDLGVHNPERALEPPSPSAAKSPGQLLSPAQSFSSDKRGGKLRNFFGQRPPSELISTHLHDFFPNAEKKVLQRTARHSLMRPAISMSRRESTLSMNPPLPSRFSSSTVGTKTSNSPTRSSFSSMVPQHHGTSDSVSETAPTEDVPRVSISTDGGESIYERKVAKRQSRQLLPPIPFPTESFSESMESLTSGHRSSRRMSRALSTASRTSRRMSYMTELRSKRDRTDTSSLLTVDEITAEVESRRQSSEKPLDEKSSDDWTKVENEDLGEDTTASEVNVADADYDEEDESSESDDLDDDEGIPVDAEDEEAPVPVKKAKWIKGALIGAGSFGKVYLGMDASSGFLMAVKQVELPSGTPQNQERKNSMLKALEHEIELLQDLQHDNIVQYLYSSLEDDCLNIFLEYVPGGSVAALLRSYGAFEEPLVKNFVRQILQGLSYLHERDIIHRDIKGANILVDNKGGVKISDFGISKKVDVHLLSGARGHRPSLQGSVFWMAPEVVKQATATTPKADIWSVGCLVVEMLTGEHPWAQLSQMQAIFKIGSLAKPTIPSDISAESQGFLARTFEIDHNARPTAAELLQHAWLKTPTTKAS